MPMTGQNEPTKMLVMPVMLNPADTVASARAAVRVARVMPAPPLRAIAGMSFTLPASGGGAVGWATAGDALMAGAVTTGLRFLRYRAWRAAFVGSALAPLECSGVTLVVVEF
jgi:hypothetical protein